MKVNKQFDATDTVGILMIYPDISTAKSTGRKNRFGQDIVECQDTIIAFRIYEYDENGKHVLKNGKTSFKEYRIIHHDLEVKLLDGHFYETDEGNFLDYPGLRRYQDDKTSDNNPS